MSCTVTCGTNNHQKPDTNFSMNLHALLTAALWDALSFPSLLTTEQVEGNDLIKQQASKLRVRLRLDCCRIPRVCATLWWAALICPIWITWHCMLWDDVIWLLASCLCINTCWYPEGGAARQMRKALHGWWVNPLTHHFQVPTAVKAFTAIWPCIGNLASCDSRLKLVQRWTYAVPWHCKLVSVQ